MSDFKLDTSGAVYTSPIGAKDSIVWTWSKLSPFEQGYAEPVLRSGGGYNPEAGECQPWDFRQLAPETVARIIEDCAKVKTIIDSYPAHDDVERLRGRDFWIARQKSNWADRVVSFPPLTVYLGDDGLVRFK